MSPVTIKIILIMMAALVVATVGSLLYMFCIALVFADKHSVKDAVKDLEDTFFGC